MFEKQKCEQCGHLIGKLAEYCENCGSRDATKRMRQQRIAGRITMWIIFGPILFLVVVAVVRWYLSL